MLSKVTDYIIISDKTPEQLTVKVKDAMKKDWVPSGPLVLDTRDYMQVMVKFEN